jgi:hypothetical protein
MEGFGDHSDEKVGLMKIGTFWAVEKPPTLFSE